MIKGLDKWLESLPEDGFNNWCESVTEKFSDEFFGENEDWILGDNGLCSKWMNTLYFNHGVSVEDGAEIIERAHRMYVKNN